MPIEIDVLSVDVELLAVRDARVSRPDLAATIVALLDDVWAHLRTADLQPGHNVVVYHGDPGVGPIDIEVGVQIGRRFDGTTASGVRCSTLPAGRAAHATHRGPYDQMAATYAALIAWLDEHDVVATGTSWERYGDWTEDPNDLETDIFFLI